jgi:hypothetical protein
LGDCTSCHQTAPRPAHLERTKSQLALAQYLREQHGLFAEPARQELADIGHFGRSISALTEDIAGRVQELDSTLLQLQTSLPSAERVVIVSTLVRASAVSSVVGGERMTPHGSILSRKRE